MLLDGRAHAHQRLTYPAAIALLQFAVGLAIVELDFDALDLLLQRLAGQEDFAGLFGRRGDGGQGQPREQHRRHQEGLHDKRILV
ncbi:hypothetical protein G6F24_018201 [Rhizopus arrhizus]|nr:hypothetical protein G6F24_018201 [Rhizopus arrhizus]